MATMFKRALPGLALALLLAGHATPVVGAPHSASIGGCAMFPANSVFNARVDGLPLHPRSADYVASIGVDTSLHPDFGTVWDGAPNGIPYTVVASSQARVPVSFRWPDESDAGPYPIPPNPPIEGGPGGTGDRHVLIVERDTCRLHELYRAFPNTNGSWRADSGAVWNLNSNELRPDTWTSADAAGLPILPLLARYDEVQSGRIPHALRFTAGITQKAHVWPARHDASDNTALNRPPLGVRFRLKAGKDISAVPQDVRVIFQALKEYGMFLADNGSNWYIQGAPDPRWDDDALVSEFRKLKGSDFEAVDSSQMMLHIDSGAVKATAPFTPSHWVWLPFASR
jgi:hypothetical protein